MSTIFSLISSNFFKKSISLQLHTSISLNPLPVRTVPKSKLAMTQYGKQASSFSRVRLTGQAHDPTYVPGKSPPDIPTAPPLHKPGIPPEVPRRPNVPDFDPIPPEEPVDPPPLTPGPSPEFPGPPDSIPRKPEIPWPTMEPEIVPPHGPDVVPPKPPEPGPPNQTQPDTPPPIMGSNGLAFF